MPSTTSLHATPIGCDGYSGAASNGAMPSSGNTCIFSMSGNGNVFASVYPFNGNAFTCAIPSRGNAVANKPSRDSYITTH